MWGFFWRTPLRKVITSMLSILAAAGAAIVSIHNAIPIVEPWVYASRGYARDLQAATELKFKNVNDKLLTTLRNIEIESIVGKINSSDNEIKRWQFELSKEQDESKKALIIQTISDLEDTRRKLVSRLSRLDPTRKP